MHSHGPLLSGCARRVNNYCQMYLPTDTMICMDIQRLLIQKSDIKSRAWNTSNLSFTRVYHIFFKLRFCCCCFCLPVVLVIWYHYQTPPQRHHCPFGCKQKRPTKRYKPSCELELVSVDAFPIAPGGQHQQRLPLHLARFRLLGKYTNVDWEISFAKVHRLRHRSFVCMYRTADRGSGVKNHLTSSCKFVIVAET